MTKNKIFKAIAFVVVGLVVALAAIGAIIALYLGTFFPVYVAGKIVIWRKIARWAMYAITISIAFIATAVAIYGADYLAKKMRRR